MTSAATALPIPPMTLRRTTGADAVLTVAGELDLETVPELACAAKAAYATAAAVTIDLGGVEFIDTAGIHTLLALAVEARRTGSVLRLRRPSAAVRRMAELTRTAAQLDLT